MKKRTITVLGLIWLVVIVAVTSTGLTMALTGSNVSLASGYTVSADEYAMLERYARLETIRRTLHNDYYQELDDEALMNGAARGMMDAVEDVYTFYYTPEEMQASQEDSEGVYNGIGVLITTSDEGFLKVLRVFSNSPAKAAGLLPGDLITAVEGEPVHAETTMDMSAVIKVIKSGEVGTYVKLGIRRGDEDMELSVMRDQVLVNRVEYTILEGNIGYLNLYEFQGDAVKGFKEALAAFEQAGVDGMIVDVRSNPGGYLDMVVDICDSVLPEGLIVYTEDRAGRREEFYSGASHCEIPMVVLINGSSASASEIFAAAMQDYGRAVLVGDTSFGKGIVQEVITFKDDNAGMQLTVSSYFTPKGRSIHKTGVEPDIAVALDESYDASVYEPNPENDNQLAAAIEALKGLIAK